MKSKGNKQIVLLIFIFLVVLLLFLLWRMPRNAVSGRTPSTLPPRKSETLKFERERVKESHFETPPAKDESLLDQDVTKSVIGSELPSSNPLLVQDLHTLEQAANASFDSLRTDSPFYFFHSSELSLSPDERLQLPETLAPLLSIFFKVFEHQAVVFDADALSATQTPVMIYGSEALNLTPYLSYALRQVQVRTSLEAKEH